MHTSSQFLADLLQLRCSTFADRLSDDGEIARFSVCPANMGETQEIEGLRASLSTLFPSFGSKPPNAEIIAKAK
jgi:hypothetical protein